MNVVMTCAVCYLTLNLICALLLHLHGIRQPHNPLRVMDVLVAFILLSFLAVPILVVICLNALFGQGAGTRRQPVPQHLHG